MILAAARIGCSRRRFLAPPRFGYFGSVTDSSRRGARRSGYMEKLSKDLSHEFSAGRPTWYQSVIIEVEMPKPSIEVARGRLEGSRGWVGKRVVTPPRQAALAEDRMETTRAFLADLLGEEPVSLRASGAFVADVSLDQLRKIAESPLVRRVEMNQTRR